MPIMTRMRDSMPLILFGLLIAFLITIIFEWGMDYLGIRGGRADVVGKVNGKKITYKEFSELLKSYTDNQKREGGAEPDEAQMKQARDQVWQSIVTQQLLEEEIKRLGITVTDQELIDWVRGDNPPEDLRRNFVDSTGQFRRDLYDEFLNNPNQFIRDPQGADPEYGTKWLSGYEKSLRQRRVQEKLQSIVLATIRVSDGELRQRFIDQNQKYDVRYAAFDANALVKDDDAQLTDADLKSYYEENLDQYKYDATRKLKYVLFVETASAADSAARQAEIEDAASKARSGIDFLQLVYTYSDKPDSGAFFSRGELDPGLEDAAFAGKPGSIIGPIRDKDGWHLLKVLEEKKSDKEYLHASHILLTLGSGQDSNKVKSEAASVAREARAGKDFAELAKKYSRDASNAQRGGDLGWFTHGRMVPQFDNAAFKARVGEIVGPVRTAYGFHLIKVTGKDSRSVKLAHILIKIGPSSQTKTDVSDRAKDFVYNAKSSDLAKEAQATGLDVRESQIQEKGSLIPGVGINESVFRWAFSSKVGSVSEPFTIPNGYAVFSVAETKDAGVRSFDEVKESLRPLALRKKKIEKVKQLAAELKQKLAPTDSLTKVAALDPAVKVQDTGPFTLGGTIPGIGRDQNFVGAVAGLSIGQISQPVQGLRGAYLIQVSSKSVFDSTDFASQREPLLSRLLQEKRNRFLSEWLSKLKDKAEIEDHRDTFFR